MCSGRAKRPGNAEESRLRGGGTLCCCSFLQQAPRSPLQGFEVIDIDEAPPELHSTLVLKPPEGPGHRLPVRTYHGAKVLVGVAGGYPDLPWDLHTLALDEEENEAGKPRRYLF